MAAPGQGRVRGAPFPGTWKVLLRVVDGYSRVVYSGFVRGPAIALSVPRLGNARDWYTIVAHADGFRDAAAGPLHVAYGRTAGADLRLVPKNTGFHFPRIDTLCRTHSLLYALLTNGVDPKAAAERYAGAMGTAPPNSGRC